MNAEEYTLILGIVLSIIIIGFKIYKLKKKILRKSSLAMCVGLFAISYFSALLIGKSFNLIFITFNGGLTMDLIRSNTLYLYPSWIILGLAGVIAYISLFVEEKEDLITHYVSDSSGKHVATETSGKSDEIIEFGMVKK